MGKQETLETIWEVPDELWERIEPIILEEDPPKARGASALDPRQMLNGIIFRLRSGCQWNRLPKELGGRQHHSSHLSTVGGDGRLAPPWWRGAKSWIAQASHGQGTFWGDLIGPNPTDRGKAGTKRSGPEQGVHDLLEATLDRTTTAHRGGVRPWGCRRTLGSTSTHRSRKAGARYPARRRTLAWLSKCRAVLVRYDNYLGVLQLHVRSCGSGDSGVSTKSAAGRRGIALDIPTVEMLRAHRARQAEYRLSLGVAFEDHGLVFPGPRGRPLDPSVFTRNFKKLARSEGFPELRLHDLRHAHAAGLIEAGVHPRVVQERLGHASAAFTMQVYGHVAAGLQAKAATAFADLMAEATG